MGNDHLPSEIFKHYISWWAPVLMNIINKHNNEEIPESWKVGIIILIYKRRWERH